MRRSEEEGIKKKKKLYIWKDARDEKGGGGASEARSKLDVVKRKRMKQQYRERGERGETNPRSRWKDKCAGVDNKGKEVEEREADCGKNEMECSKGKKD